MGTEQAIGNGSGIVFVTGTDTGVGKTLTTGLLLLHLQARGVRAWAIKPFCSGGADDVRFLQMLQPGAMADRDCCPWLFSAPVTPFEAARIAGRRVQPLKVVEHVLRMRACCEVLIVEGAGGLRSPLCKGWTLVELMQSVGGSALLVGRNRLGVINHATLSLEAMSAAGVACHSVILNGLQHPDASAQSNLRLLRSSCRGVCVQSIPWIGNHLFDVKQLVLTEKKIKKTLAQIVRIANLQPALRDSS